MIRSRILGAAAAVAIAGGSTIALAPAAGAANTLVACSGLNSIAKLNPAIQSNDARYVKAALKQSDGSLQAYLTLAPIPADNLTCLIDSGISTDNPVIDENKPGKYTLDDQTNGNSVLTRASNAGLADGKTVGSVFGAATCNSSDVSSNTAATAPYVQSSYPDAYPLQGKTVWKFEQLDTKLHQIQIQQYLRTGTDPLDPDPTHITVKGIAIKGPGLGGDVSATLSFYPTDNAKKNLNPLECTDANVSDDSTEASLAELWITQADGSDAGTAVDLWSISLP